LTDLVVSGDDVWARFNGGKQGTMWYYQSLVQVFQELDSSPMVVELARVVERIERIALE
jgi:GTP pyrophosphokinase